VLGIDGVIRQVVEEADAGVFVPPGNSAALANAIRELANDPERGRQLGQNGREYVARKFNRREHGEQFTSVLRGIAARP